jgi:hypothetical protein
MNVVDMVLALSVSSATALLATFDPTAVDPCLCSANAIAPRFAGGAGCCTVSVDYRESYSGTCEGQIVPCPELSPCFLNAVITFFVPAGNSVEVPNPTPPPATICVVGGAGVTVKFSPTNPLTKCDSTQSEGAVLKCYANPGCAGAPAAQYAILFVCTTCTT